MGFNQDEDFGKIFSDSSYYRILLVFNKEVMD
jgi:hypothetical protein